MQQGKCPEPAAGMQYPDCWFSTVKPLVQHGEAAAVGSHGPSI
jgi:hypothetical protein